MTKGLHLFTTVHSTHLMLQVIQKLCVTLRKDEALEKKLTNEVPGNHVVPGSSRMNARSGTTAFRMQVVRWE